jgi:hypothetical protein
MSYAQKTLPFKVIGLDYIATAPGDTMGSYARRIGKHLIDSGMLDRSKPLFLAGASFGGVIAQELSNMIRCDGVIMISTYRHRDELARALQHLGSRVAPKIPLGLYQLFRALTPLVVRAIARLASQDVMLCSRMYGAFPKRWFRDQCRMAATWRGCELNVPKLRIHGSMDIVIPNYSQADVDLLLEHDMHMCSLSRREVVNAAIQNFIEKVMSKASG